MPKNLSILNTLQIICLSALLLYFGKTLFIPLSLALLLSFVLYPICIYLKARHWPDWLAIGTPVLGLFLLSVFLIFILINQVTSITIDWQQASNKFNLLKDNFSIYLENTLGINPQKQQKILDEIGKNTGNGLMTLAKGISSSLSSNVVLLILTPIFSFLFLAKRRLLVESLYYVFPNIPTTTLKQILTDSIHTYHKFVTGMFWVYLLVALLNFIALSIIGVPHPLLYGILVSVFTFIPYIGIIIASIFPITQAWLAYNTVWQPLYVVIAFTIIQTLEAYVIFPYIVGNKLRINTLSVFIAIIIGGILWGAVGMILFIPMISVLKLISEKIPSMHFLSKLLGD